LSNIGVKITPFEGSSDTPHLSAEVISTQTLAAEVISTQTLAAEVISMQTLAAEVISMQTLASEVISMQKRERHFAGPNPNLGPTVTGSATN
jgi:hypothetical protein